MKIIYSDNHLCVVVKPANLVVPIENQSRESLEAKLKAHLQKELGKENIFLRPIHRLDKPVEGIVVFARSSKALKRLQEDQRNHKMQKHYLAFVEGSPQKKQQRLTHQLIHGDYRAEVVQENGKVASLSYRQVFKQKGCLSIILHTGRYHQIRAQLSEIGHPISGDIKYGSETNLKKGTIALYHTKFILTHPVSKKKMTFIWRPAI